MPFAVSFFAELLFLLIYWSLVAFLCLYSVCVSVFMSDAAAAAVYMLNVCVSHLDPSVFLFNLCYVCMY